MLKSCIDCWLCRRECRESLARFNCFTFGKAAVFPVCYGSGSLTGFRASVPVKPLKRFLLYNPDMKFMSSGNCLTVTGLFKCWAIE